MNRMLKWVTAIFISSSLWLLAECLTINSINGVYVRKTLREDPILGTVADVTVTNMSVTARSIFVYPNERCVHGNPPVPDAVVMPFSTYETTRLINAKVSTYIKVTSISKGRQESKTQ
jgi:hypothetical protein